MSAVNVGVRKVAWERNQRGGGGYVKLRLGLLECEHGGFTALLENVRAGVAAQLSPLIAKVLVENVNRVSCETCDPGIRERSFAYGLVGNICVTARCRWGEQSLYFTGVDSVCVAARLSFHHCEDIHGYAEYPFVFEVPV